MNYDAYGEVINGEETFKEVAEMLKKGDPVLLGWTDQDMTHFDILLVLTARPFGTNIQGGIRPREDLFVSVMRWGAFGFDPRHLDTHSGYYAEKLRNMGEPCQEKFSELINGIKAAL